MNFTAHKFTYTAKQGNKHHPSLARWCTYTEQGHTHGLAQSDLRTAPQRTRWVNEPNRWNKECMATWDSNAHLSDDSLDRATATQRWFVMGLHQNNLTFWSRSSLMEKLTSTLKKQSSVDIWWLISYLLSLLSIFFEKTTSRNDDGTTTYQLYSISRLKARAFALLEQQQDFTWI